MIKKILLFILGLVIGAAIFHSSLSLYHFWSYDDSKLDAPTTLEGPAVDKQVEFTKDMALLIQYATDLGYKPVVAEVARTMYQQRHYVSIGRSWTYNSYHLKKRAVDILLFDEGGHWIQDKYAYEQLADYWETLSPYARSGVRWRKPDIFHYEINDNIQR